MRKFLLASAAIASLAGSTFAFNAFAAPGDAPTAPDAARMQHMQEHMSARLDARLAGMKADLKLTPDQEKAWPAFETAVRDAAKARAEAWRQMHDHMGQGERPSPIEHMTIMSDRLQKKSAELKVLADASKPLYDSLTDDQKRAFGPMMHEFVERGPHEDGGHRHHDGEGDREHMQ